jgi:type I restriction enzyme S subunit
MASEWEETTLGAEVDLLTGFPFKSERYTDSADGIRLVRGDNIVQGAMRWDGVKRWPLSERGKYELYELHEGDVVLAMDRPWIEAGLKYAAISKHDLPCLLVQRTARLRGGPKLDSGYLRYLIGSLEFTQHIHAITTGTAVPHISGRQIKDFTFALPPLPEQKAIAAVLGALDDKIELTRRMNATLETIARALFKSWFVDFDPVRAKLGGRALVALDPATAALFPDSFQESSLGPIPKGWEVCPLSEKIQLLSGGTPKTSEPTYWGGDIPWYSVRDAPRETDVWVIHTDKYVTKLGIANSAARLFPEKTTVISARGTVGTIALTAVPMAMNQSCYGVRGINGYCNYFTYYTLRQATAQLQRRTHGTVFDTINTETFKSVNCIYPTPPVTAAFDKLVEPLLEGIRHNLHQSRTLAALRHTLMPALLSGELSVTEANL